jgi:hypothetical protein
VGTRSFDLTFLRAIRHDFVELRSDPKDKKQSHQAHPLMIGKTATHTAQCYAQNNATHAKVDICQIQRSTRANTEMNTTGNPFKGPDKLGEERTLEGKRFGPVDEDISPDV